MKNAFLSNKFVLYIITTVLWANLLLYLFRTTMTFTKMYNYIESQGSLSSQETTILVLHIATLLMKCFFAWILLTLANHKNFVDTFNNSFISKLKKTLLFAVVIIIIEFGTTILEEFFHFNSSLITLRAPEVGTLYQFIILFIFYFLYKKGVLVQQENDLTI